MVTASEIGADTAGSGTLMLHLLGRCNLECRHCYMLGGPRRSERIPIKVVQDAIAECSALGVGALYLTGGEPLLYPRLRGLLEKAASVPGLSRTLSTNGTLLDASWAAQLAEFGFMVNVSIDGPRDFHDVFRAKSGAFEATERASMRQWLPAYQSRS